jgi:hypothetical protein
MAMTMLNIGILAIVAAFNSGAIALQRAAKLSTASALADQQMELYRALKYDAIYLDTASEAATDSIYQSDSALSGGLPKVLATCPGLPVQCTPSRIAPGADGKEYRVDAYILTDTPPNGRALKRVVVVVRERNGAKTLARVTSTFDASTGS